MNEDEQAAVEIMCSMRSNPPNMMANDTPITILPVLKPKKRKSKQISGCEVTKESKQQPYLPNSLKAPPGYILSPNTDVRHSYPQQFVDGVMSGDVVVFRAMMKKLFATNVTFASEYNGEKNPFGPNGREYSGIEELTNWYLALAEAGPDSVMTVDNIVGYRNDQTDTFFLKCELLTVQTKVSIISDKPNNTSAITINNTTITTAAVNKNRDTAENVLDQNRNRNEAINCTSSSNITGTDLAGTVKTSAETNNQTIVEQNNKTADKTDSMETPIVSNRCVQSEEIAKSTADVVSDDLNKITDEFEHNFHMTTLKKPSRADCSSQVSFLLNKEQQIIKVFDYFKFVENNLFIPSNGGNATIFTSLT